jgi:DNA-binding NtrC family response regulator
MRIGRNATSPSHVAALPSPKRESPSNPRNLRTILVVDNKAAIRHVVRRGLERLGYRVMLADKGEAALKLLLMTQGRIDVVVSDTIIPRVGLTTRFLFTSAGMADGALAALRSRPGTAFLAKPWTIGELVTMIQRLLDEKDEPHPGE